MKPKRPLRVPRAKIPDTVEDVLAELDPVIRDLAEVSHDLDHLVGDLRWLANRLELARKG